MTRYAMIENGVAIEVLRVDPFTVYGEARAMSFVACPDEVETGWLFADDTWAAPPTAQLPPLVLPRHITNLAFRLRFTMAEKVRIELASLDNPGGTMAERTTAATLRAVLADAAASAYKDLDHPATRDGVQQLEALGLLDHAGRALEILDAPIAEAERFTG